MVRASRYHDDRSSHCKVQEQTHSVHLETERMLCAHFKQVIWVAWVFLPVLFAFYMNTKQFYNFCKLYIVSVWVSVPSSRKLSHVEYMAVILTLNLFGDGVMVLQLKPLSVMLTSLMGIG